MREVKVLGPGCARCRKVEELVRAEAERLGIAIQLEKVTDYAAIATYGVASTPGIVIDGAVVHAGGLPRAEDVARWLAT
jgi:small redox-active disulfide protein 2